MMEASLVSVLPMPWLGMVTFGLTSMLMLASAVDLAERRIPDVFTLPLIGLGIAVSFGTLGVPFLHHLIGAGGGYLLLAVIGEVYFRRHGVDGLGLGDAKLFAAAGAWLGWSALPAVLLIAAGGGLMQAMVQGNFSGKSSIAFGPWLSVGFWLVWMEGVLR